MNTTKEKKKLNKVGRIFSKLYWKLIFSSSFLLILGVAIYFRLYRIDNLSFWNDESFSFSAATYSLSNIFRMDPNMSFFHLIAHFWVLILPNRSEGMLRGLPVIFSVISIPVVFLLGKVVGSGLKKSVVSGLIAALFVTLNAYHIQYAQEFRSYSLVFLLSTLSTLFLIKAIKQSFGSPGSRNRWWLWYVLVSIAAVYSHFFALFILLAQITSLLVFSLGRVRNTPFFDFVVSAFTMMFFMIPLASMVFARGSGQIAWISEPTLNSMGKFAIQITGNQGLLLLAFYILFGSIGFLVGFRAWLKKDFLTVWKFILMANCFLLPIVMTFVISKVITPIFQGHYLLFVMPYLSVLAALGIVTLAASGWNNWKLRIISIPVAISVLALIITLSTIGIKSYFENFQKEEWRETAQFLTTNCLDSKDLSLYYMGFVERDAMYYNANLRSQIKNFNDILNKNPDSNKIAKLIPDGYNRTCLVISHVGQQYYKMQKDIQAVLRLKFPNVAKAKFYQIDVEIYNE